MKPTRQRRRWVKQKNFILMLLPKPWIQSYPKPVLPLDFSVTGANTFPFRLSQIGLDFLSFLTRTKILIYIAIYLFIYLLPLGQTWVNLFGQWAFTHRLTAFILIWAGDSHRDVALMCSEVVSLLRLYMYVCVCVSISCKNNIKKTTMTSFIDFWALCQIYRLTPKSQCLNIILFGEKVFTEVIQLKWGH